MNRLFYLSALAAAATLAYLGVRSCAAPPAASNAPPVSVPAALQSAQAALRGSTNSRLPEPERVPLYVLPEVIAVMTPTGQLLFAPQLHVEELARRFPSARVTNVVIWSRP